ncbi:MAG TPA: ABC transporter permease [Pirellulaceae bacterium]|nr:ABC transporter permease [Pirellulaceae bacterium]
MIEPSRGWQLINLRELWQYRELFGFLIWRDVKVRYKQTLLGAAWAILQPALMMIVFTVFFARLARVPTGNLPYPLFVYAGLLPWLLFSTSVSQAAQSVLSSERLITKVYFPRLAIPLASVGAAIVDFVIALVLLLGLMLWYGVTPTAGLLVVPLVMGCLLLAATGVGTAIAALNVAYRDFRYLVPFLLQMWMFATPTIYMDPAANGAGRLTSLLALNPLAPLVSTFRAATVGEPISWLGLLLSAAVAGVMFLAGCAIFRRFEDEFSDII